MSEPTATMRAVGFERSLPVTDPDCLLDVELPRPTLRPHDLLVAVEAVSVNPVDTKQRRGGDPEDGPRVLGFDAAGTVVAVGPEVTLFSPGDEVWYAGDVTRPGTDAELHAVDERLVGPKPATLSWAGAAALPLTTITAWEGLFDKLRLTGESRGTLLVVGASGGVGSMVLQLCRVLLPWVRVVATASTAEAQEWVRSLGAHEVVDHHDDLAGAVRAVAPEGLDWVFTGHVGAEGALATYVELLKPFGEIVAIDDPAGLDVTLLKPTSLSLHWEFMFARAAAGGEQQRRQHRLLADVAELVDRGLVRSTLTTELGPLDAATLREAHRQVEDGHVIGKVVVTRAG